MRYCQNLMSPEPWYPKEIFAEKYLEPLLTYGLLLYWVPPPRSQPPLHRLTSTFLRLIGTRPEVKLPNFSEIQKPEVPEKNSKAKTRFSKIHFFHVFVYFLLCI